MNFAVFDYRIDALSTKLASAREQDDTQMLADQLAHIIRLRAEKLAESCKCVRGLTPEG